MAQVLDSTNLPLVVIDTYNKVIPEGTKIPAGIKIIFHPDGRYNHLTDTGNVYTGNAGIEIRGRYSASLPQKPYGFETRDASGSNLNVSLLGMPAENDWILLANYNDKSFIRNALAFRMFRDNGNYAPRTALCEVVVNGAYQGIYVLCEKIKPDKGRVNIKKLDNTDNSGDALTGGYIFSVDYYEYNNYWKGSYSPLDYPDKDVYFVYNFPKPDEITVQQAAYIQQYVRDIERVLYGSNFLDPVTGYRSLINTSSFINYFIVNEVARNVDGYKKSCFYNKDRNSVSGLLNAGPVWDFDWAWKNINECYFGVTNGAGWAYKVLECNVWPTPTGWIPRMMEDPQFVDELKIRYSALRKSTLSNAYLMHYVDSVNLLISDAQVRHFKKWPILGQNVGAPEVGFIPGTFSGETTKFKNWITTRMLWLDSQLLVPDSYGIDENPALACRIFPNPAKDVITIETSDPAELLRIYSYDGKQIKSAALNNATLSKCDVNDLKTGIYVLRIDAADGKIITKKFIVE